MSLKFIVAAVAAASLVSGAALAEQPKKAKKQKRPYTTQQSVRGGEFNPNTAYRNDPNAVYYAGTYMGSDPDPRVRAEMLRQAPSQTGDSN